MAERDDLTIFENDIENQVEFYLTTAILMNMFTGPENYAALQKVISEVGGQEMPITREQLEKWVKCSRNTAHLLHSETEEGLFSDPNPFQML
jgi:hypothetical protein